jgi:hypothetical protein
VSHQLVHINGKLHHTVPVGPTRARSARFMGSINGTTYVFLPFMPPIARKARGHRSPSVLHAPYGARRAAYGGVAGAGGGPHSGKNVLHRCTRLFSKLMELRDWAALGRLHQHNPPNAPSYGFGSTPPLLAPCAEVQLTHTTLKTPPWHRKCRKITHNSKS